MVCVLGNKKLDDEMQRDIVKIGNLVHKKVNVIHLLHWYMGLEFYRE